MYLYVEKRPFCVSMHITAISIVNEQQAAKSILLKLAACRHAPRKIFLSYENIKKNSEFSHK